MMQRLPRLSSLALAALLPLALASAQNDPTQVPEEIVEVEAKLIEASGLANQGDTEAALDIYNGLLAEDPRNSAAAYSAARLYQPDNAEKALTLMQQAHRHDADNAYITQALAEMLSDADRHQQAADLYAKLFKRFPKREEFLLQQTQSLSQGGKPREGLRTIEQYVADGGRLTPFLGQQRFTLAVSMNDRKAAVRALEELMAAYPGEPDYYQELAQFYRRTGDEASARAVWTQMAEGFPDDSRARLGLAGQSKLNAEEEDFIARLEPIFADETLEVDAKIMQLMPIVQEVANRGDTVLANRVLPLAQKLTEVHPSDPKGFAILADIYLNAGRPAEAVENYRATLALNPSIYLVWDQLLLALAESNQYDELLEESENALLLFPNQARLYYYNGRALARTGDLTAGENTLLQGVMLALDDQVLLYDMYEALARVQMRQARFDDALANVEKAIAIRPKNGPSLALKAEILFRADQTAAAKEVLAQAGKEGPRHPYVIAVEALAATMDADVAGATNLLQASQRFGGDRWALVSELKGDLAYLRGDVEEAKQAWEYTKSIGGGSDKLAQKLSRGTYVK